MTPRKAPNIVTSFVNKVEKKVAGGTDYFSRLLNNALIGTKGSVAGFAGAVSSNQSSKIASNAYSGNKTYKAPPPSRTVILNDRERKARPDDGCKWNLPPHVSSLPVRARDVIGTESLYSNDLDSLHRTRRGAIWYYDTGANVSTVDDSGVVESTGNKLNTALTKKGITQTKVDEDDPNKVLPTSYNYGFQFLWNPDQISTSVSRNMDVTPSNADRLRGVSGAFPGQESVSFSIVLDRVNDFAMLRSVAGASKSTRGSLPSFTDSIKSAYKHGLDEGSGESINQKLYDLSRLGTMADLEYLFKCINGSGTNAGGWTTLLNKETSNIGFLAPNLLAIRLGPSTKESLSYVGWATSLSINHTMFTEEMIPLRTTVSFSIDCFAGSTLI
jgi:hypothetical protein